LEAQQQVLLWQEALQLLQFPRESILFMRLLRARVEAVQTMAEAEAEQAGSLGAGLLQTHLALSVLDKFTEQLRVILVTEISLQVMAVTQMETWELLVPEFLAGLAVVAPRVVVAQVQQIIGVFQARGQQAGK
jgi:hypothetical protein